MKITEIRTRAVQWEGKTVPLPPHFCTNPMDLIAWQQPSMGNFAFHSWLLVEIFTDAGLVGLGNAALAPHVTKQVVDLYLKPVLLGQDPWDIELLWQHMYRSTMAFGRKGIGMTAISAVDIALWDLLGKAAKQPVYRLLGGRTKQRIPVYASRLYAMPLEELASEAKRYKDEGYRAMKFRFGWGPVDGAAGMQRNVELIRTVREAVGYDVDVMADAYMGWTLDYARRMLPLLEPYNLRWLEEPVIPDDTAGYAQLKAYGRVPIAGGEHEYTLFGFRDLLDSPDRANREYLGAPRAPVAMDSPERQAERGSKSSTGMPFGSSTKAIARPPPGALLTSLTILTPAARSFSIKPRRSPSTSIARCS